MKKIRNSKRGFTLTEIIVVVAIIVIVSAAAFVGIAITINNAKANAAKVDARHGQDSDGKELFEAEAWKAVDEIAKGAAKYFDVSTYDPDDSGSNNNTNSGADTGTNTNNNGDLTSANSGEESDAERKAREAAEAARIAAEEEAAKQKAAEEEAARKAAEEEAARKAAEEEAARIAAEEEATKPLPALPDNLASTRPNTNGTVKTATSAGQNAPGASTQNNGNNIQASFGGNVESVVYHVPSGCTINIYATGNTTNLGNGYYRWTSTKEYSYPSNMSIVTNDNSDFTNAQARNFYVVEVVIHNY